MREFDRACAVKKLRGPIGALVLELRSGNVRGGLTTRSLVHTHAFLESLSREEYKLVRLILLSLLLLLLAGWVCLELMHHYFSVLRAGSGKELVWLLLLLLRSSQVIDQLATAAWTFMALLKLFLYDVLRLRTTCLYICLGL